MTSSLLFNITTFAYLALMLLFFVYLASRATAVGTGAISVAYGGLLAHTVAISLRWKESYDMGKRAAWLSIIGFAATIFCYLGVNLFLSGLHSYGGK